MKLPSYQDLSIEGKKVLLRTNYDVPITGGKITDTTRIEESLTTINYLLEKKAQIIILSHLGRPEGKKVTALSLKPIALKLGQFLKREIFWQEKITHVDKPFVMLENLRFNPQEEANDLNFAQNLAQLGDFFINEAFANSHRRHASIVGIPQFLPSAFGANFIKEVGFLTPLRERPQRPVVLILGGIKKDKLIAARTLAAWADWLLIGGKLVKAASKYTPQTELAELTQNGFDISPPTAAKFAKIILKAKTIVWVGPLGDFYQGYEQGTRIVAQAIVESQAVSVVGGGDTEAALTRFGLDKKISFICSGGGALLAFLAQGTLPGIEAVKN